MTLPDDAWVGDTPAARRRGASATRRRRQAQQRPGALPLGHEQRGSIENVCRSLRSVVPSHLADHALYDFGALGARDERAAGADDWLRGDADLA